MQYQTVLNVKRMISQNVKYVHHSINWQQTILILVNRSLAKYLIVNNALLTIYSSAKIVVHNTMLVMILLHVLKNHVLFRIVLNALIMITKCVNNVIAFTI